MEPSEILPPSGAVATADVQSVACFIPALSSPSVIVASHVTDVPDKLRWQYESVTIRPNDSPPVDITQTVAKGAGKHIIIEATAKRKSASETKL